MRCTRASKSLHCCVDLQKLPTRLCGTGKREARWERKGGERQLAKSGSRAERESESERERERERESERERERARARERERDGGGRERQRERGSEGEKNRE